MALDTPSSTPPSPIMTSTVTSVTSSAAEVSFRQLVDMWHPHVYRTPPKSPTPFSIGRFHRVKRFTDLVEAYTKTAKHL